jgi:hypothetical protein
MDDNSVDTFTLVIHKINLQYLQVFLPYQKCRECFQEDFYKFLCGVVFKHFDKLLSFH